VLLAVFDVILLRQLLALLAADAVPLRVIRERTAALESAWAI